MSPVNRGRAVISPSAEADYLADIALAARFPELLGEAQAAEADFRQAQAADEVPAVQYPLARALDAALTAVTRAAYAAERAEIGPRGYEDRIFRRKAKATAPVKAWTREAERLLTLRETHRLTGFPARPEAGALEVQVAHRPAAAGH
jgi:hypothetical protein